MADADEASRENAIQPGPISLSLPVEQYAGRYTNDTWGTLTIEVRDGALAGGIGNLAFDFFPGETDSPVIDMALGRKELRFIVRQGRVKEARIPNFWGITFRFVRAE